MIKKTGQREEAHAAKLGAAKGAPNCLSRPRIGRRIARRPMPGEYPRMCSRVEQTSGELPIKLIGILASRDATQLQASARHSCEVELSTTIAQGRHSGIAESTTVQTWQPSR